MRFIIMHKNDTNTEDGNPPSMEIVQKMGAFIGGYAQSGKLVDGAGLKGSKYRARVNFNDGTATVKQGPYAGERELPASFTVLEVKTFDEGLAWADRYGKILGTGEIEVGTVTEPWDIGVMPMPENPPLHLMLIEKADKVTEGAGRSTQQKAALSQLKTEMTNAGVFTRAHKMEPSNKAKRLTFKNNKLTVVDGPFAESKELIGGFAVLDLDSIDEAIALCIPYAEILGGNLEIDVRGIDQSED